MKIIVAIGGNMISNASDKGETFEEQQKKAQQTAKIIVTLLEQGHEIIITHGNGPQVGSLLLQQHNSPSSATKLPLNILGALTQGQIGVTLQHAILNELNKRNSSIPVFVIPTTVEVDANDPGFENPSKPIGPFYSSEEFEKLKLSNGYTFKEFDKGMRQVVPSPKPVDILEAKIIEEHSRDSIIISVGGGGTPVIRENNNLKLVDAVIDKDLASSLLARKVSADLLLILTDIDGVYKNFGKDDEELLSEITADEAKKLMESGEFESGSIGPKVQAGIEFSSYGDTIITSPEFAIDSILRKAGTRILKTI